mgnify:CR=1 FL=1
MQGTASGPCQNGMCAQSEWNFANCSNNCPLFEGCAECTAAPGDGCAYCLTEEVCVGGDDAHKCRCARESCGVCEAKTGCADCTDDPACGWCASANGGKGGCLPAFDQHEPCDKGACPAPLANNWQYGKCAVNCTLFSASCAECTAHYADSGCEWCEATEACLAPAQFTSCPACLVSTCPNCGSYESCSECIGDASCGWCSESEACVPGEAGGACGGPQVCPAPEWNYETCAADCASLETCTACTAMATEAGALFDACDVSGAGALPRNMARSLLNDAGAPFDAIPADGGADGLVSRREFVAAMIALAPRS